MMGSLKAIEDCKIPLSGKRVEEFHGQSIA